MKSLNLFAIIILSIIILLLSCSPYTNDQDSTSQSIKIGVILPLSGDFAALGQEFQRGIELAAEEVNAQNKIKVTLVFEDDQSLLPTAVVNAAHKLIDVDKVDAGLTMIVEQAHPAGPIFSAQHIPLLVLWDSNKKIRESGDSVFSNGFSTEKAGEDMAVYASAQMGARSAAVIRHNEPWSEIIADSFEQKFEHLGGKVLLSETLQADESDYRVVLSKTKKVNPDVIYFPLIPPTSLLFLNQVKEMGINKPLLTGDAFIADIQHAAGQAAEGVIFTNTFVEAPEHVAQGYTKKYGSDPSDVNLVVFGYEGVKIIEEESEKQGALLENLKNRFGSLRSIDRTEKIYQIQSGIATLV